MNTPVIIGIVVAVIAVLALVTLGLVLARRRRVSLGSAQDKAVEGAPEKGGYETQSGFSFSQGNETAVLEPVDETPDAEAPVVVEPDTRATAEPGPDVEAGVEAEPAPAEPQLDEIAPTAGRLGRLRGRLARSQGAIGKSMLGLLGGGDLDESSWEEIEDTLLMADVGTSATTAITDKLRAELAARSVRDTEEARTLLKRVLTEQLHPELDRSVKALPHDGRPAVVLVVGVNGTGKTTTTGKLARVLVADGRRVLLGAADTFRAAAADQLQTWGERVGADTVRGNEGADPASVAFDAVATGIDHGVDVVIVDTAGRLHTKTGLMDELGKVKRVVEKKADVDEVLLVLDATIGQNGLAQAKVFAEVVDITGVVLTKLDGTAKGGIVFAVQEELGVPVKLVGLGEGADDLAPFDPGAFVDALL
ncbi:signal recognition particle receptor [Gordonia araii NBRC 100433]|uniref:Signal recognition particle receptor FtsY n=1 Tax=Gordonia araii NBRC 100433 TaxID=1073574 RepID=G7H549_9ACTN|nr:signal recognition particle-docking protein FtsY [Gordonia araii]NNG96664.1 signal recognition particle-docking protein FtsY [Gordonia araii NBRC 100433]GAB10974.1 signal recognition particle receptor [Gordonia araii NBRC 100433]